MATQNSNALPDLDMSTSVPISHSASSSALPDLDMSTSVPVGQQTTQPGDFQPVHGGAGSPVYHEGQTPKLWDQPGGLPTDTPTYITNRKNQIESQGIGLAKSGVETVHTVGSYLHRMGIPMPDAVLNPAIDTDAKNTNEKVGKFAENLGELWVGSEASKALGLAEKIGVTQKIQELAKTSPTAAKIWSIGLHAVETNFPVTTIQQMMHGASLGEAAKTGVEAAGAGAALEGAGALISNIKNPFRGLFQGGAEAAQGPAQTAIRTVTGAAADAPIIEGSTTAVDAPIRDLETQKAAAYQRNDKIVGFDLKAEKAQLKNDLYEVKQPSNIDKQPDIQQRINESTARIAQAHKDLAAAGVDPKEADALNTAWKAGQDFKKFVQRATAPDGNINIDQLAKNSQNSRTINKYGDRLAQFFGKGDVAAGKPIADKFMADLAAAKAAGVQSVKAEALSKLIKGYALRGAIEGTVGAAVGGAAYKGGQALGWWGQ